ncbi:MAG: type II toxin-antitoxin system PemK/MazF family toxin [Kineosporiaceae bacterium]|nr:type II toxin-antitoxin system PemK/MazF family toxin [Kineosporiaceae bacterium]
MSGLLRTCVGHESCPRVNRRRAERLCQHRGVILPRATSGELGRSLVRWAGRLLPRRHQPGDYAGDPRALRPVYAPRPDGEADGGEVVWAWVPYEDDPRRGKDRPVLVLGRDGPWLLALMMTSTDHDHDQVVDVRTDRAGRVWMDVGSGAWDSRGRPSEVRLDRVLRLDPGAVRREGAALDRGLFEQVTRALRDGW